MYYEFISIKIQEETAIVYLDRPKALNALNKAMVMELDKAFDKMAADPNIKSVVITGV